MGVRQLAGWFIMENPMDDLGISIFQQASVKVIMMHTAHVQCSYQGLRETTLQLELDPS